MNSDVGYAGDVSPKETWEILASDSVAFLIDVRTRAEWTFVGIPDLSAIGKTPVLVEWQVFPDMAVNDGFRETLTAMLAEQGAGRNAKLFMLCRSGMRSRSAAREMTAAGFDHCFNISTGFEGNLDENGKRGNVGGWKVDGLPWRQG